MATHWFGEHEPGACFNPRHPRGVATRYRTGGQNFRSFNPRHPRGVATRYPHNLRAGALCFNPRHPRGVATLLSIHQFHNFVFQSTPPAWGGDGIALTVQAGPYVSIHATRVGWRPRLGEGVYIIYVSIHATRVGWRPETRDGDFLHRRFNPRHPRGVATSLDVAIGSVQGFNPRHPRGVATPGKVSGEARREFQSTPPAWGGDAGILDCFSGGSVVSIHATRVGWRQSEPCHCSRLFVSIHATRVGWRQKSGTSSSLVVVSIHATRVGWRRFKFSKCLLF